MILEDNPFMIKLLMNLFSDEYQTIHHENGILAFEELMQNELPHLILSNLFMPEMNGLRFLKQLKTLQSTQHIPLIMHSMSNKPFDKIQCLSHGAAVFLNLPLQPEQLLFEVRSHMK